MTPTAGARASVGMGVGMGLALALTGAVAFSGKAIIIKLAYRHGVDAVTLLMYRMLFALPLFLGLAWWAGRGRAALTARDLRVVVVLGFSGYYLASYLDFLGLQHISAGLERLILYLNPTLVLLLGVIFFKHRVKPLQLLALGVSYAGVLLVFGQEVHTGGADIALGAALVFGSALSYAVCGSRGARGHHAVAAERHAVHVRAGAAGDDGAGTHRCGVDGAGQHGGAAVHAAAGHDFFG